MVVLGDLSMLFLLIGELFKARGNGNHTTQRGETATTLLLRTQNGVQNP